MGFISPKLRASAKGQECTFQTPWCSHDPETVMLCHAPSEVKGMANKGHDYHGAFGCHECHTALDQHKMPKVDELYYWLRGVFRTQTLWVEKGLVVVSGIDPAKPKTRPKKKTPWPSKIIRNRQFGQGNSDHD